MAYTSIENINNQLETPLTTEQAAYFTAVLSPAIDKYIDLITNTSFSNTASTVYVDGTGTDLMPIPTMNTITAVNDENGDAVPTSEYAIYPFSAAVGSQVIALRHKNGTWTEGTENYSVVGKLGHSTVPADIKHVATMLAINSLTDNHSGLKSEKVGDWSATYADVEKSISPMSMNILKSYDRLSRRI